MKYFCIIFVYLIGRIEAIETNYVNVTDYPGELCYRKCLKDDNRICYFKFVLEYYQTMGVACGRCAQGILEDCYRPQCIVSDGVEKGIMSINRQLPSPPIRVCKGDLIVVDVDNRAHGTAASIHWHGLHQRKTPWMDGVPFVTQCPIPASTTFQYYMYATEPGTHFYHSHSGHHKINGQSGVLIVDQPIEYDPMASTYDNDDHYLFISDIMHAYGEQLFPGLPSAGGIMPDSVLINGLSGYIDPKIGVRRKVPFATFNVEPNKRYRFRIINAVSHACPIQLQIEKHNMTVISLDSYDVRPKRFETIILNSGERFDVVVHTEQTLGDYWIRARAIGICAVKPMEGIALLRYESNEIIPEDEELTHLQLPQYEKNYPLGVILNHPSAKCFESTDNHCIAELEAIEHDYDLITTYPDFKYFFGFQNSPISPEEVFKVGTYNHFANLRENVTVVGAVNNLSLAFPSSPPLTQPLDIDEAQLCDEFNRPKHCIGSHLCPCVHMLNIPLGSKVEILIVDESAVPGPMFHPFHIHGTNFYVMSVGQHPDGIPMNVSMAKEMEQRRGLPRTMVDLSPPSKDTVSIPSRGYAILRFRATNPGYWLVHCHYEWHLAIGMGFIFKIGKANEMVEPPKNFPTCGNFRSTFTNPF